MTVFTLTLIRHGETECNRQRIIQGQIDTDLAERGILQAELCGRRLQNEKFTHAFTSDLKRAFKTCEMILLQNKVTKCPLIKDIRLRERKFGEYEGRSSDEFFAALKKAKVRPLQEFAPPNGESLKEVRQRAVEWFQDVCKQVKSSYDNEMMGNDGSSGLPGPRRQRQPSSLTNPDIFTNDIGLTASSNSEHEGLGPISGEAGHTNSGSTSSTSDYSSTGAESSDQLSPSLTSPHIDAVFPDRMSPCDATCSSLDENLNDASDTWRSPSSSPSYTATTFQPVFDSDIRLYIRSPQGALQYSGCPNVSLSPIFEHRFSSVSSMSSGRNSSFDDTDISPLYMPDVLVVSHGGFLKELIAYFCDELGAVLPGGLKTMAKTPYNTAVTKFTVSLSDDGQPRMTCLVLNDRDHLLEADVAVVKVDEI